MTFLDFRSAGGGNGGGGGPVSWDSITNKPAIYSIFPIWAEENAALLNNAFQWALGNGNDTPSGSGVVVPFDCELIALTLSHELSVTARVQAWRNSGGTGKTVTTNNAKTGVANFEGNPAVYLAGQVFNFRTDIGGEGGGSTASAWFRRLQA